MRTLVMLVAFLASGAAALPAQKPELKDGEGYVSVPGGRLWYRVVGKGGRTPLLVVHGCCGVGSYYLAPLAALADDRPVIFYDQIDNGRSDRTNDTTYWRMAHFVEEIKRIRETLGLREIHLYGHSFGAAIVADYMLTKPRGVRSVVIAGAQLDMSRGGADLEPLLAALPDSTRRSIVDHERDGTTSSPAYQRAMLQFMRRHYARRLPWSADLDSSVAHFSGPMAAFIYGAGPTNVTGWMRGYRHGPELRAIEAPTLLTIGRYDDVSAASARQYQTLIPGSRVAVFEESGHLSMQDEPDKYVSLLRAFLRSTERP
jgi:proline-specific peptidase